MLEVAFSLLIEKHFGTAELKPYEEEKVEKNSRFEKFLEIFSC